MKNVIGVQVVDILAGNDIDFVVPVFIQIEQRIKLLLLMAGQVGEILQDKFGAHRELNMIALVLYHFKHQLAGTVQLRLYRSERSFQFNGNFFI